MNNQRLVWIFMGSHRGVRRCFVVVHINFLSLSSSHSTVELASGRRICQSVRRPVCKARGRCRISPPRFLAEWCKRQLNQGSFVLLYFRLFTFSDLYWVYLSVFSCTVLFVSISQVIGCENRLRNDLYCIEWGVKLYSNQLSVRLSVCHTCPSAVRWRGLRPALLMGNETVQNYSKWHNKSFFLS